MLRRELWTRISPLYSMKPSFLKRLMKKLTRVLHLKENSVRKPSDPRSSPSAMNYRKLQCSLRDGCHRSLHCNCKTLPKARANVVVPSPRLPQFCGGLGHPDDGQLHGFLNRSDLTFSQGMTSEGFCSRRSIRESNSARCASVSVSASASRLSHTSSSNSAFSAAVRLAICSRSALIAYNPSAVPWSPQARTSARGFPPSFRTAIEPEDTSTRGGG